MKEKATLIRKSRFHALDDLDLVLTVAVTKEKVVMVEAEGNQVKDETVYEGIEKAFKESQSQIKLIEEFAKAAGKEKIKMTALSEELDAKVLKDAKEFLNTRISKELLILKNPWRDANGDAIKKELAEKYPEELNGQQISALFEKAAKEVMNDYVLNQGKRIDGRKMEDIREIYIETGVLPQELMDQPCLCAVSLRLCQLQP